MSESHRDEESIVIVIVEERHDVINMIDDTINAQTDCSSLFLSSRGIGDHGWHLEW